MSPAVRLQPPVSSRLIVVAIIAAGVIGSIISYQHGRVTEAEEAEAIFRQRAAQRHTLAEEILNRFEDSLFGLSMLFAPDRGVSRAEFVRAASRLEQRIVGAQAFEWVPLVTPENRADAEAALQRVYPRVTPEIADFDASGERHRAPDRPFYYPITYLQPLRGNERALGYDLAAGPTAPFLERARETRQMVVTSQFRLVQETAQQQGVVMIWPVFRVARGAPSNAEAGVFAGFLQCVFRVHDLLETVRARQPVTMLDMLFIDASETDPARRVLYYRPARDELAGTPAPPEAEFRQGIAQEFRLPVGGRDWRVLFRPRAGWMAEHTTSMPVLRSGSILLVALLLAGLVSLVSRRTETIKHEVAERTAELAESRRQFASIVQALPGMSFRATYDDQMSVTFVSEGALALTGWSADEFINGAIHYRDCIHPEDVNRVREMTRDAIASRQPLELEYRIRTKTSAEKWVLSRGRAVFTADNQLQFFEGLVIDITAQKNAEQARLELERKLLEGQKLESLGLLAGGIAHDFNNLLSAIIGNANLLRIKLPADLPVASQLEAIETASVRAAELCRQMLAYAGKGRFVVEPVDLTALTEELLPLLKISVAQHARLKLELARNLPAVHADQTQLRQIVMNLVLNASDAIAGASAEQPGEIVITTGTMHATHEFLLGCVAGAGLPRGDYVFLKVRDNGCGMPPHVLAKIFDPFFTTKFAGRGLGLAATLGIVRGHRGALCVETRPGAGSTFRLLLPPLNASAPSPRLKDAGAEARWHCNARVLIIEDEEPVRIVTGEMLRIFGLTVEDASSGEEGLQRLKNGGEPFDVVVLDLLMPGLGGERTLTELRALHPELPVLLMSGYSETDVLARVGNDPRVRFLPKPFTRATLEAKLRELLATKGGNGSAPPPAA